MRTQKSIWINIIGIIVLVALLLFGVEETEKYINKVDWKPTEVYEMANKNISWD